MQRLCDRQAREILVNLQPATTRLTPAPAPDWARG